MSENMEVVGTELAMPEVEAESTEESTAVQETVETTVETEEAAVGEDATPPAEEDTGTAQDAEDTTSEGAATIPVPYNHGMREMTADEAVPYIQMGLKMEEIKPEIEMLRTIAAANGQTFGDTVRNLWGAFERSHRQEILQRVGGNEEAADALMEKKRSEWNAAFETAKSTEAQAEQDSRKALENRLMEGYTEIRETFPNEYPEFKNIPQAVVNDAIKNNRGLLDALLRYRHKEGVKIEQNRQTQQRAAAASAGSRVDKPTDDPGLDSIERAFFDALG